MIRSLFLSIALLATFVTSAPAQAIYAANQIPARGVSISYSVTVRNPVSHLYDIVLSIEGVRDTTVQVAMPAWAPGAYTIRDYARNVQNFRASAGGEPLTWEMADKQTWQITKRQGDDVEVQYQLYSAQLTHDMADLSGPATFMYVVGYKHVPVSVRYDMPDRWKVHTGLDKRGDRYHASDYDVFIDAPAFIGDFKVLDFESNKIPHRLVFSKRELDMVDNQILADINDIVDAGISMFGKAPYKNYTFLFKVQPQTGSGGLEHLNSTRITVGENDFTNQSAYRRFLFVVAHEYFHLWNVKRIRPAVLGPFDYSREVYTRALWISEGLTSYYGHLLLARAGVVTPQEFFDLVGAEINVLQHAPGRRLMSAEEASWLTWTRSDNAVNSTISYYTKGEIVGLLLDIEIRARTKNQKSLDDVMRYLMTNYAEKGVGFPEDGFLSAVETVAGSDFDEFFQINVQSRQELDYNRYLQQAGLQVEVLKTPQPIYVGIEFERADGNLPRIRRIVPNSPAERARLDLGDILIAMDGERLTFDNFRSRLHAHGAGQKVKLTLLRGERLMDLEIVPADFQEERWTLTESGNPTPEQIQFRNAWLGVK